MSASPFSRRYSQSTAELEFDQQHYRKNLSDIRKNPDIYEYNLASKIRDLESDLDDIDRKLKGRRQRKFKAALPSIIRSPVRKFKAALPTAIRSPVRKFKAALPTAVRSPVRYINANMPTAVRSPVRKFKEDMPTAVRSPLRKLREVIADRKRAAAFAPYVEHEF